MEIVSDIVMEILINIMIKTITKIVLGGGIDYADDTVVADDDNEDIYVNEDGGGTVAWESVPHPCSRLKNVAIIVAVDRQSLRKSPFHHP